MPHAGGRNHPFPKRAEGEKREPTNKTTLPPFLREQQPDLAALIEAWPTLPDAIKVGIQAMVRAAQDRGV